MITEFKDYRDLPFSKRVQDELAKRHSHAEIANATNPEQIVYTEKDVLILLQMHEEDVRDTIASP